MPNMAVRLAGIYLDIQTCRYLDIQNIRAQKKSLEDRVFSRVGPALSAPLTESSTAGVGYDVHGIQEDEALIVHTSTV